MTETENPLYGTAAPECREIDINDPDKVRLLLDFYSDVYIKGFPDVNQRESLEHILVPLSHRNKRGNRYNNFHVLVALLGKKVIGGVIGDYFSDVNSGVVEFIAVDASARNHHTGSLLVDRLKAAFFADARAAGYSSLNYVFIEAEDPERVPEFPGDFSASLRLKFWKKQNFRRVDFQYLLPSLEAGKSDVDYLLFAVNIVNLALPQNGVPTDTIRTLLHLYAYYSVRILAPERNSEMKRMLKELAGRTVLDVLDMEIAVQA